MPRRTRWIVGLVAGVLLGGLGSSTNGHTPIASRFTYNEHLFPIFEKQCGSCHIDGGVAPMSLLTYQEAFPWTQSIREEVLGLRMPPWKAEDGFGEFLNGHVLPAHELDMILEWSSGGYPEGPRDQRPTPPSLSETWTLGTPSLDLTLSEPFLIDSETSELIRYFSVPTALDIDGWITGIDILPGSRAVVLGAGGAARIGRSHYAAAAAQGGGLQRAHILGQWTPPSVLPLAPRAERAGAAPTRATRRCAGCRCPRGARACPRS